MKKKICFEVSADRFALLCSGAGGLGAIPFADRLKIMADDRSIPRHQSRVRHGGERHGARSH